jgi:hypothetical protein
LVHHLERHDCWQTKLNCLKWTPDLGPGIAEVKV